MAVRLDEWIQTWHQKHPGEKLSATQADQIFTGLCRLLQKEFPSIEASSNAREVLLGLCPAYFLMERDQPAGIRPTAGSVEYCPAEEPVDETTCMFGMGLILYELLIGDTYANKVGVQVGMSDFLWSFLKEQADSEGRESLVSASDLPAEYRELGEILTELTQYDREARPASLLEGEIPACEYEWKAIIESSGQIISKKSGLLNGIDASEKLPLSLEKNGKRYEAVDGQVMEISYSFLRKSCQTRYREVVAAESAGSTESDSRHGKIGEKNTFGSTAGKGSARDSVSDESAAGETVSWEGSDLGLLVNDGAGGLMFAPLILAGKRDVRYRLRPECPPDYSSWRTAPPLQLTVMRRKRNCGAVTRIEEKPDAFREERRFTLNLEYPGREKAHPELELTEKSDGGFKIRCEWVNADGRTVGASEVEG